MTQWIATSRRPISATVPTCMDWPNRAEIEAALGPVRSATHAAEIARMESLGHALANIEKARVGGQLSERDQRDHAQFLGEHRRLRHTLGVYPLSGVGVTG